MLSAEDIRLDLLSHLDSEIRMNHVTIDFIDRTIAALRLDDDQIEEPLGQVGSGDGALPSV